MSMSARPYRGRGRSPRSEATRARIRDAVHQLLAEGRFHESSVEAVAERAGVSRATLYQHFRSRLELVDAICESFDANPALLELRELVELEDPRAALARTVERCVAFWSSEDAVLVQLYDVAAVDPAARALVDRQRADRRGEMRRLVGTLERHRALRAEVDAGRALAVLMLATSYDAYRELRAAGLDDAAVARLLRETAAELLVAAS